MYVPTMVPQRSYYKYRNMYMQLCITIGTKEVQATNYDYYLKGCQNTPAKASRYCTDHNHTAMVFRNDDADSPTQTTSTTEFNTPGSLIVKIINQKTTRQGIIYEVFNKFLLLQLNVMN